MTDEVVCEVCGEDADYCRRVLARHRAPVIEFVTTRTKPLAEVTAADVPRGLDPEDVVRHVHGEPDTDCEDCNARRDRAQLADALHAESQRAEAAERERESLIGSIANERTRRQIAERDRGEAFRTLDTIVARAAPCGAFRVVVPAHQFGDGVREYVRERDEALARFAHALHQERAQLTIARARIAELEAALWGAEAALADIGEGEPESAGFIEETEWCHRRAETALRDVRAALDDGEEKRPGCDHAATLRSEGHAPVCLSCGQEIKP